MTKNPFVDEQDKQSEFKLHMAIKKHYEGCFIGVHNPDLKIFHIANENRDSAQGHFNKMLGVLKGMPDLMAGWPDNTGICEVKLPGKPLSGEQNKVLSWAAHIGWHTGVARTVKQAHDVFVRWGLKPLHHRIVEADYRTLEKKKHDSFEFFRR